MYVCMYVLCSIVFLELNHYLSLSFIDSAQPLCCIKYRQNGVAGLPSIWACMNIDTAVATINHRWPESCAVVIAYFFHSNILQRPAIL